MRKIAIAMAKGGVGKTTTAVNLAHGLANHGYRVLLVDCDTQGQVSKFLGVNPDYGLYEFITERGKNGEHISKNNAIYPSRQNLWLLAGGVVGRRREIGGTEKLARRATMRCAADDSSKRACAEAGYFGLFNI
jgi:cellulose biosynthesis protein BcsQ